MRSSINSIAALALAVLAIAACADPSPAEPTAPPAAIAKSASVAPTPTHTAAPFPTPTHTAAPAPTPTHTAAPAPTPTHTAAPALSPTPTHTATPTPRQPVPARENIASLDALSQLTLAEFAACGLREDGSVVCVGFAWREDADQTAAFSAISSGLHYFCVLRDDGAVSCQGESPYCETCAPDGAFSALSAGKHHACALNADGEAVCWGWNREGRATPPPGARFSAIAAGGSHSCGIAEFGDLICWGWNGGGRSEPREGPFSALALGTNHTCALRWDGAAFCQGDDSHGEASPPSTVFAQIAAGVNQTCGITPKGGLECWGVMPISDHSEKFASVSVGYGRTCALTAAGAPKCWPLGGESRKDPTNGAFLSNPVEMFPLPAGGVALAERLGYIVIYPPDGGEPRTALDLTERTRYVREGGMLSAALDPDFAQFPFIYIYWQTDDGDPNAEIFEGRVSRFPMTRGGEIDADGEHVILRLPQTGVNHYGGALRFGPDGMLYLGLGDRSEAGAGAESAPDIASLAGKIIRIDVRGSTEETPYRVPPDNPFVGDPDARPEIWALGLRNPWRMSFAPNGDLVVADVGHALREEVSIAERGANLGWPLFEASHCAAQDASRCGAEGYTFPIYEYPRNGNCAIIGGMFAPDGKYIFGDYCSGRVWSLEQTAPDVWRASEIAELGYSPIAFGADADGSVYALNRFGYVTKVSD